MLQCSTKPYFTVKVSRVTIGPEIGNCKPVLITFRLYRDREEVWRKAGFLRGSSLHITEDVTRRTKDSRAELRR